jgi:hypothetical protein
MKKHEKAFTEIKCYYNDITHNNLDLIKTLKVHAIRFFMFLPIVETWNILNPWGGFMQLHCLVIANFFTFHNVLNHKETCL